jgi:hypothetical protein
MRTVCAALLVCVLTDGGAVAAQTAGTPQGPPTTPSGGALRLPGGLLDPGRREPQAEGRSAVVIAVPSATDTPGLPKGWTFRFESPDACATCPGRPGVGTPWRASGTLSWQRGADTFRVGVTGERGARLPLFMTEPVSGNFMGMPSDVVLSDTRTHWVLKLSAEHILLAVPGRTASLFGDLYLPLGAVGRAPKTVDMRKPAQAAVIGGVRVRSKAPLP